MSIINEADDYIAINLTYIAKKDNMTQAEFGETINESGKNVGYWMRGDRKPSIEQLCRISKRFGISLDDLVNKNLQEEDNKKVEEYVSSYSEEIASFITKILLGDKKVWDILINKNPEFIHNFDMKIIEEGIQKDNTEMAEKYEKEGNYSEANRYYLTNLYKYENEKSGWSAIRCLRKTQDNIMSQLSFSSDLEKENFFKKEFENEKIEKLNDIYETIKSLRHGKKTQDSKNENYENIEKIYNDMIKGIEEQYNYKLSHLDDYYNDYLIDLVEDCLGYDDEIKNIKVWIVENIYGYSYNHENLYWGEDYKNKVFVNRPVTGNSSIQCD